MANESSADAGASASEPTGSVVMDQAAMDEALRQARDQHLRALAELDNVRKRAQREIETVQRYAVERFASELLAVRDSLELAVNNATTADAAALVAGQKATLQLLERAFDKFFIVQVNPQGATFDPSLHEAVLSQESATAAPNSVLEVLQPGYQLNGRLLRPARVIVARAPESLPGT
jgi:molecular chaperone GrpE